MSDPAMTTRWARRSVAVGVLFLVGWQATALAVGPGRPALVLALLGFVWHVAFGKAYALVPSYFARSLAWPRAPAVQVPLTAAGTGLLAADAAGIAPTWAGAVGAACWALGVLAFLGALGWTIRDNPTGGETGTGETKRDRQRLDRYANAFVPVAFGYLAAGSYQLLALETDLPRLVPAGVAGVVHLLGAGGAALLVFAVGLRLLPRLLVAAPPTPLALAAPPTGAVAPALLAVGVGGGVTLGGVDLPADAALVAGALLEAFAVVAFALVVVTLFVRSDRRRVGGYGVVAGALAGCAAVALGLAFAAGHRSLPTVVAHRRLNLLGLLGLTVVGLLDQFYPPSVGTAPGTDDRTAAAALLALGGGLAVEVVGLLVGAPAAIAVGRGLAAAGAATQAYLLLAVFGARPVR